MHHTHLRNVAKFAAGFVAADLISVLWMFATGYFPLDFLGVVIPETAVLPIVVFDLALLIMLVHVGWNIRLPVQSPREKTLLLLVGVVFAVVALMHLTRVALDLDLIIGTFSVPEWVSWAGLLVTGYLAYACFHYVRARK